MKVLLALLLALAEAVHASETDIPAEIETCGAGCSEEQTSAYVLDCREEYGEWLWWGSPWGRAWVGPIRYVGPFEVSIQAKPNTNLEGTLPLFVGIRTDPQAAQCQSSSAGPFWSTNGTLSCDADSMWITFPRVELHSIPLGAPYWVQVEGFITVQPIRASSPYWRCIRVRAFPTAVTPTSWGGVKTLYK